VQKVNTQTISELKLEFEKLCPQMTLEVRSLFSLLFKLFEVLLNSLPKKRGTSTTSDKPPSQDPFRKKRKKKDQGNRPGRRNGHAGSTLAMSDNPDRVIIHPAKKCDDCGSGLKNIPVQRISRHQVIDIKFKKIITEHQVEHKRCHCGNHQCHSSAGAPVKYGPELKAISVELNQVQCIPYKRCAELFQQKFDITISPATLVNFASLASERLAIWEEEAKSKLLKSVVLHADETGININGENFWVHVLSNESTTLMIPHFKRGSEAMIEAEVLPQYNGILCHDFWSSYSNFDVVHAVCHSHLQREFTRVYEDYGQSWAKNIGEMLIEANEERKKNDGVLTHEQVTYYEREFTRYLSQAKKLNSESIKRISARGKIKQSYPRRLLNRLIKYRSWILIFLYDPSVPFTNNQAERDIRMLKVQQKVSGYFKSEKGARDYCRIRSYILSMQKQGYSKHQALTHLFRGT